MDTGVVAMFGVGVQLAAAKRRQERQAAARLAVWSERSDVQQMRAECHRLGDRVRRIADAGAVGEDD